MLHHAFPPLGGKTGRFACELLKAIAKVSDISVDFVSISNSHVYQSEPLGSRVVVHRLNVYKEKSKSFTERELFEYQAKSYIFILRTSRKIEYDLIHAIGIFPESFTAYAFKSRFPYFLSLLPSDESIKALRSMGGEFRRAAEIVFDHSTAKSGWNAPVAAKSYLMAYRQFAKKNRS